MWQKIQTKLGLYKVIFASVDAFVQLVQVPDLQSCHVKEAIVEHGERVGARLSHITSPRQLVHIFLVDKMHPLLRRVDIVVVGSFGVAVVVSLAGMLKNGTRLERIVVDDVGGLDSVSVERPVEVGVVGRQIAHVTGELYGVARTRLLLVYENPRVTLN